MSSLCPQCSRRLGRVSSNGVFKPDNRVYDNITIVFDVPRLVNYHSDPIIEKTTLGVPICNVCKTVPDLAKIIAGIRDEFNNFMKMYPTAIFNRFEV